MKPRRISRAFTLLELLLASAILGVFLYLCAQTLISTMEMEQLVNEQYDQQRERSMGWSIMQRDLQHTVGIYYHHQSLWEPPEIKAPPKEGVTAPDSQNTAEASKKTKKSLKGTSDELVIFTADAFDDEPFLELVVSRGRVRDSEEEREEGSLSTFRKVKYYLTTVHEADLPEGQMILRTEERWQEASGKGDQKIDDQEKSFDLDNYRRYGVLMGLKDVEFTVYNGTEWIDEWSSLKQGDLPLALRIEYTREDEETDESESQSRILSFPLSYQIVGEPEEDF